MKTQANYHQVDKLGTLNTATLEAFQVGQVGLALVEEKIKTRFDSDAKALSAISNYLLTLGGKRVRPLLAILSSRLFSMKDPSPGLIDIAAGIELIHMATLLHDDIIDKSPTRRSHRSAYKKYGLPATLLAGDFLLVKAFGLCAHLDKFIVCETENACVALTEGEILEGILNSGNPRPVDGYLDVIGKKTASLFALATLAGAFQAGADSNSVEHMRNFGYAAGIAFQIIDDVLDLTADEDLLGKPSGTDLRQKTPSLVNILWLLSGDSKARAFFNKHDITKPESKAAAQHILNQEVSETKPNIIEQCQNLAKTYAAKANKELTLLPSDKINAETRNQLIAIIEYTLNRCL